MIIPLKAAVLTAGDPSSGGKREDPSGRLLRDLLESLPAEVVAYRVVPDDKEVLIKTFIHLADILSCDLILTIGGTGLGPRDWTPEATREVIEKEIPGISEAIRESSLKQMPGAMLSRAVAGVRRTSLIINLPAHPAALKDAFEILRPVLSSALQLIKGRPADSGKSPSLSRPPFSEHPLLR